MLNPEFNPLQNHESEVFCNLLGFDKQEIVKIGDYFNRRLIKGFYRMSSGNRDQDILTIRPSLDIDPDIGLIDDQVDNMMIVALSRLKGIEAVVDLVACRYIDIGRLGYGPKTIHIQDIASDQEKKLSCTKTVLPIIDSEERFELTKEVYSLHKRTSEIYPLRVIGIDYSLSWSAVTLYPKNS